MTDGSEPTADRAADEVEGDVEVAEDGGSRVADATDQTDPDLEDETDREGKTFDPIPAAGIVALFSLSVIGGVALVGPFEAAGYQAFENPGSLSNVGVIVVEVVVATAVLLVAFRYDLGEQLAKLLVLAAMAYLLAFPLALFLPAAVPSPLLVAGGISAAFGLVVWLYPEWYVINLAGVAFGATAIGMFGISLTPLPVLALLVLMAAYDAYSVYVSEHMQSLGSGVVDLKLPMVFVVPTTRSFSLRETDDLAELGGSAMLLGVGDAVFPGLLAGSAATFVEAPAVAVGLSAPALGALVGALVGMALLEVLLFAVRRTHAGLPVLNACVIAGYLLGAVAAGVPLEMAVGI